MKISFVFLMKFFLVHFLRSWLLSGLCLVARCGFLLALATGFTAQPVGAAEPTNSVLHFDGNGSYLELPPHSLDGYKAITVEAWVRPERLGNWTRFFEFGSHKDRLAATWHGAYNIQTTSVGQSTQYEWAKGFISRFNNNGWLHLAVVADGKKLLGFLNGELIIEKTTHHNFILSETESAIILGKTLF